MGLFTSTVGNIRRGLRRTRAALTDSLRGILHGQLLSDELITDIESHLIRADLGVETSRVVIEDLRAAFRSGTVPGGEDAIAHLKQLLKNRLGHIDRSLITAPEGPTVILIAGINGAGKTTSVAKVAHSLRDQGRSVLLGAADTFRAGATEQLAVWADRLGVDIIVGEQGADPAAVTWDATEAALARGCDTLLIDTAGRLHTQTDFMHQLTKIRDVVRRKIPGAPHEVLLVLDATAGQNAVTQARLFKDAIDITGIFLAKLDGTARGGMVLSIYDSLGIPVKLIGVGETLDDVEPFDPETFIDAMFSTVNGDDDEN